MKNDNTHDAAERLRYVFENEPKCPRCESKRLKVYGKVEQSDSTKRYVLCRDCQHKFQRIST